MKSIYIKELNSFFSSIVGYVALLIFLVICGIILWVIQTNNFTNNILQDGFASLDPFFSIAGVIMLFLVPAITMRSFPDEFRGGTIEWLSTKPLRDTDIILGKYFAAITLVAFALLPTLVYVVTLSSLSMVDGNLDTGAIIGSYIGLYLSACAFTAIGIFCSSLTSNQIVGFLVALFANAWFYWGFEQLGNIPQFIGEVDYYLTQVGMSFHYNSISRGYIDTRDVVYFLSVIILFIALTRLSLNRRTWDTAQQD
ncbi:MAG: ABC transporter permease [Flavipsychrobacter sp.]|nr:ABC transporter permease [Flavipsychrobacter sp.]